MTRKAFSAIGVATLLTMPWLWSWLPLGSGLSTVATVGVSGVGILGAAFLLTWGAETAEKDVPRAFAIAVLAVLAVAPEYAVDALYAWNAGAFAGTPQGAEAGNLAVANMTGANRILIGIGWAGIALFTIFRSGAASDPAVESRDGFLTDAVTLDHDIGLEIVFLFAATVWAFAVPLGGGIGAIDFLVLVGIYAAYLLIVIRGEPDGESDHGGVPGALQQLSRPVRIGSVLALFAFSGLVIFTAVKPFAHGLESLGTQVGIPAFFMIQWIAPLASESPELIVVLVLVNKARSTAGFNALISSKLNQWTLLIGTLVVVYSLALGQYGALPFDQKQAGEIWLTAAQSLFALALIVDFEISIREAIALLVLFVTQVATEFLTIRGVLDLPLSEFEVLLVFSVVYVVLSVALLVARRDDVTRLAGQVRRVVSRRFERTAQPQYAD
mgnify:CR=1 FL=1